MHVQSEEAIGLPVELEGLQKRTLKAPLCGTGGHKHGHKVGHEAFDQGHARPPPSQSKYYMR